MPSPSTLGSLLMKQYGPLANPIPNVDTLAADIAFVSEGYRNGEEYVFPTRLGFEQGATHNTDHSGFALNDPAESTYKKANLSGAEIVVRGQVSYGEMALMSQGKGRSHRAYDQGVGRKIADLADGAEQRREMCLAYGAGTAGAANLGVVNAIAVAAAGGVVTVNLSRASWINGFWQQFIGGTVDVFTAGGVKHNAVGALKVTGVDPSKCRITLTGAVADAAAVAADDQLFFVGGRTKTCVGIEAILSNTGSLFGIDAALYPQWKAVSYAVGGALSFDKVAEGCAAVADNGLSEGLTLYVSTRAWTDLLTDEVALRRYVGEKGGKASPGFSEIEFEMACGPVKIKPYKFMKQGLAFGLPTSQWKRIGSTDLTATLPGNSSEYFYQQVSGSAAAELRFYSDQAIVSSIPYQSILFTGVSSTADNLPA